jgi:hypothetical protein
MPYTLKDVMTNLEIIKQYIVDSTDESLLFAEEYTKLKTAYQVLLNTTTIFAAVLDRHPGK